MKRGLSFILALVVPTFFVLAAFAVQAAPVIKQIPYSKKTSLAVPAKYFFRYSLWTAADPLDPLSTEVWMEEVGRATITSVTVKHTLGSVNPLDAPTGFAPVDFSQQLYVQMEYTSRLSAPYTMIGGRAALTTVPYALWGGAVASDSVTSIEIADGSILDADINPGAAIADSKLAQIATPGKVADSALSADVVLTGNDQTITGTKTFNPAAVSVPFLVDPTKNAVVANLNAEMIGGQSLGDLDVRFGVTAPPQSLRGYATVTLDSAGDVGGGSSITIGADGFPVISYFDATNADLKVAHCGNAACSSGNTITTVDSTDVVGKGNSITIGADGLPIISYFNDNTAELKVAHCGNAACSAGNTITTLPNYVELTTSITIGADGLPLISYEDVAYQDLRVIHCGNAACSSGNTTAIVDSVGLNCHPSITIGADGLPIIAYDTNGSNGVLKVAHCGNATCSSGKTITIVDSSINVGESPSITIGADGLPIISYYDAYNDHLKVIHCGTDSCWGIPHISPPNTIVIIDSTVDVGWLSSITIGADGLPIISYYDATNSHLKVAYCGNAACSAGNTSTTVDSGNSGYPGSITTGADGLPIISYYETYNGDLKVAKAFFRPPGRR